VKPSKQTAVASGNRLRDWSCLPSKPIPVVEQRRHHLWWKLKLRISVSVIRGVGRHLFVTCTAEDSHGGINDD
jgi:hypothetical protein